MSTGRWYFVKVRSLNISKTSFFSTVLACKLWWWVPGAGRMIHGWGLHAHLGITLLGWFLWICWDDYDHPAAHLMNERNYKYNSNWCDHGVYQVRLILCIDWGFQRDVGAFPGTWNRRSCGCRGRAWADPRPLPSGDIMVTLSSATLCGVKGPAWVPCLRNPICRDFCPCLPCLFSSSKANNQPGRVCLAENTSLAPQLKVEKGN